MTSKDGLWIWRNLISVNVYRHKRTNEITFQCDINGMTVPELSRLLTQEIVRLSESQQKMKREMQHLMSIRDMVDRI